MSKTYIVAPNFSMGPTSLQLGDVIEEPLSSELVPLNRLERIVIPERDICDIDTKTSFSLTRKALLSGRLGVWAQFLGFLGLPIGANAGVFMERNSTDIINVEALETHRFIATDSYLKTVMESGSIGAFLKASGYDTNLYMITGLKIARNASLNREASRNAGATLGPSAEGSGITLSPALELISQRTNGMAFESSTDFILAFQVRKVKFKVNQNQKMEIKHKSFGKGATMLDGGLDHQEVEGYSATFLEEASTADFGDQIKLDENDQEEWIIPDISGA